MILKSVTVAVLLALAPRASASMCPTYRMIVEKNEVFATEDVERWGTYALKAEGIYNELAVCFVHVVIPLVKVEGGAMWGGSIRIAEVYFLQPTISLVGAQSEYAITFGQRASTSMSVDARRVIERFISEDLKKTERMPFMPVLVSGFDPDAFLSTMKATATDDGFIPDAPEPSQKRPASRPKTRNAKQP